MVCAAFLTVLNVTSRLSAFKYDSASKLSVYNYTTGIYSFIFDLWVFNAKYDWLQYLGIFIIFAANVVSICETLRRIRKEEFEKKLASEVNDAEEAMLEVETGIQEKK